MIHTYLKMLEEYFRSNGSEDPETDAIMLGSRTGWDRFSFYGQYSHFPGAKNKAETN